MDENQPLGDASSRPALSAAGGPSASIAIANTSACQCLRCLREREERVENGWPVEVTRMVLCVKCGCKRCPHATDHNYACTDSNEPGQLGSAYGVLPDDFPPMPFATDQAPKDSGA